MSSLLFAVSKFLNCHNLPKALTCIIMRWLQQSSDGNRKRTYQISSLQDSKLHEQGPERSNLEMHEPGLLVDHEALRGVSSKSFAYAKEVYQLSSLPFHMLLLLSTSLAITELALDQSHTDISTTKRLILTRISLGQDAQLCPSNFSSTLPDVQTVGWLGF